MTMSTTMMMRNITMTMNITRMKRTNRQRRKSHQKGGNQTEDRTQIGEEEGIDDHITTKMKMMRTKNGCRSSSP